MPDAMKFFADDLDMGEGQSMTEIEDNDIDTSAGSSNLIMEFDLSALNIRKETYVSLLVKDVNEVTNSTYVSFAVCQGEVDEEGEVNVLYMIKFGKGKKTFILDYKRYIQAIAFEKIVRILPKANVLFRKQRVVYQFPINIDILE